MLYGFELNGEIIVVAGDSRQEFDTVGEWFDEMEGLEYYVPSLSEMIEDARFAGMRVPPYVISGGDVPSTLVRVLSHADAMAKLSFMLTIGIGDSISAMFSLYESEFGNETPEVVIYPLDHEEMMVDEVFVASEFIFAVRYDKGNGTTITIVSKNFYREEGKTFFEVFEANQSIGGFLTLPEGFTELTPGIFEYEGTPLSAREQLLDLGYEEDLELSEAVRLLEPSLADGSTFEETVRALGLKSIVEGSDFMFGLCAHPHKTSTFAVIVPADWWAEHRAIPFSVHLTPVLDTILPYGFGEHRPGFFEILRPVERVLEQVLAAGMIQHNALTRLARDHAEAVQPAPDVPTPASKMDFKTVMGRWETMTERDRQIALPDTELSFCVVDDASGANFLFLVPTAHFQETSELLARDLSLEHRLMGSAEKVAPNIFKVSGLTSIDLVALMNKNGFKESYSLLLHVNLSWYTSDLMDDIGFDPI